MITRPLASVAAALVVAGSVSLAGCSSNGRTDPCSLLTRSIVGDVTGVTMLRGAHDDVLSTDTHSVCAWRPTGSTYPVVQVFVSQGADQVASQRADAESEFGASKDVTIAGATDAYVVAKGSLVGMVIGDEFIQVAYIERSGTDVTDYTVKLAEAAAGRA